MTIGERIVSLREDKNITQRQLTTMININVSADYLLGRFEKE